MKEQMIKQFQSPVNQNRPKMRWWLPGAFMSNAEIKREIEWLADAGYGGAEIIHFFAVPSDGVGQSDYEKYGFGSSEWNDRMKATLEAAIPLDFRLDFTVGPLWPIATPAILDRDDPRCTQGLHVGMISFDGTYNGPIPESETIESERPRKLVAVTAARKLAGPSTVGKLETLALDTAIDLTDREAVDAQNNRVQWTAPDDGEWCLFGFWSQTNGQMNDSAAAPVIDHFSKEAAEAVTDYWDSHLLGDTQLRELYERNAGSLFCDSIELNATMLGGMYGGTPMAVTIWTPDLLQEFRERRGYDLTPYLPSLFLKGLYQLGAGGMTDGDSEYDFDYREVNRRIRNDFFATLTDLFRENHLRILRQWANSHRMTLRYQTYGMPTELTAGLLEVDIPETESLGFGDSTDGYRFQSGAAHLSDKEIYSIEVGAVMGYGYKQTWTGKDFGLLWQLHRGMAAGVNQAVLHGMSYETASVGDPFGAMFQWPGLSLMGTRFSNEWGGRQPHSRHARDIADYIARNQFVLRTGKPKVDLAVYRYHIDGIHHGMGTEPTVFEQAGYSYDFVSPALLDLEQASVGTFDGKPALAADGPAYKAIVVDMRKNTDRGEWMPSDMSVRTAEKLIALAEQGLPVVIVGEAPNQTISYQGSWGRMEAEDTELQDRLKRLMELPTVNIASTQRDAVVSLAQLSVEPAARTSGGSHLLTVRRYADGANYYFLYNPSLEETFIGEVVLVGEGQPFMLNAWDGAIRPLAGARTGSGRIAAKLRLAPNAAALIATAEGGAAGPEVVAAPEPAADCCEIQLNSWSLTVESWTAGSHPTETKLTAIEIELDELKSWTDIPVLKIISGIGRYRTEFELDANSDLFMHAVLDLGELSDTFRLTVNGTRLHADQIDRRVSIGGFMRSGVNTVEVEVATTLNNALSASDPARQLQDCGLMGPVLIRY
ncbi:glycosyl hydrolase [Paenibacillus harenae]|uniref:glycosyl hydrolase n=1 Tax=Paenibacillus harenae TaxID=306543 RepID=UPI0003FC3E5A|nr:glycosyl hydrolase [Paenibacillus harenae]